MPIYGNVKVSQVNLYSEGFRYSLYIDVVYGWVARETQEAAPAHSRGSKTTKKTLGISTRLFIEANKNVNGLG